MTAKGKVFLVDDDPSVQRGVAALLRAADYEVDVFPSGDAFLGRLPDLATANAVLLADVRMPGIQGTELQAKLARDSVALPVVIMTAHGDIPMAVRAMQNGAAGFLEKPFTIDEVTAALDRAFSKTAPTESPAGESPHAARLASLSPREREVLNELIEGATSKEIARTLDVSPRTIEVHRRNIMAKMQAGSLAELIRMALQADQA